VNDATKLVSAVVNELFEGAFDNFIVKSAEAIGAGNQAKLSRILGEDSDVNALRDEVARQAIIAESAAFTSTSAALEVAILVNDAAKADESLFLETHNLNSLARSVEPDIQPSSLVSIVDIPVESGTNSPTSSATQLPADAIPGDAESAAKSAAMNSHIQLLPGQHQFAPQFHVNGADGHLSVIQEEENGADQSGKTSPHSPDGERRALFTTSAQSLQQCVEDRAPGAQPNSSSSNLGSIPQSGQSGTTQTHELPELLASLAISSKPSFKPAADTSCDGSNLAQSSSNPLEHVLEPLNLLASLEEPPPLPSRSSPLGGKIGGRGVQSSGNPIGNPPGIVLSNVGVSGNPHADQSSFPPQGDVGGLPVQVLASSENPPEKSGGADHPKTPSSPNLWSSCIPGGNTSSASQPGNSSSSWRKIFRRRKSNSVNPDPGQTNDTRPPVAHSSGKSSESAAATILPPSSIVILPTGRTGIGGSPLTAHPPGDPLEIVPIPAPSSSSTLGSAATSNVPPHLKNKPLPPLPNRNFSRSNSSASSSTAAVQCCPLGQKIGVTERNKEMLDIAMVFLLAAHNVQHGRGTIVQDPCFSKFPPAILLEAGRVA
jgi:hypothetical protein